MKWAADVMDANFPWSNLELSSSASTDDVRRAYARKLKVTRPDEDPAAFQNLVAARDCALLLIQDRAIQVDPVAPEQSAPATQDPTPRIQDGAVATEQPATHIELAYKPLDTDLEKRNSEKPSSIASRLLAWEKRFEAAPVHSMFAWFHQNFDRQDWDELRAKISSLSVSERQALEPVIISIFWQLMRMSPKTYEYEDIDVPNDPYVCNMIRAFDIEYGWGQSDRVIFESLNQNENAHHFLRILRIICGRSNPKRKTNGTSFVLKVALALISFFCIVAFVDDMFAQRNLREREALERYQRHAPK